MIRLLYNLRLPLGLLFFLPGYIMKMRRRGNYRRNFGQRFAHYDPALRKSLRGARRTWLHAVSVGDNRPPSVVPPAFAFDVRAGGYVSGLRDPRINDLVDVDEVCRSDSLCVVTLLRGRAAFLSLSSLTALSH